MTFSMHNRFKAKSVSNDAFVDLVKVEYLHLIFVDSDIKINHCKSLENLTNLTYIQIEKFKSLFQRQNLMSSHLKIFQRYSMKI